MKKKKDSENKKTHSTSETGHAKNIANFQALIQTLKTMTKYKPSTERFTIPGLETCYDECDAGQKTLVQTDIALGKVITERQNLFEPVSELSTRVINALADTEANDGFKKEAASILRKLHGRRVNPIKGKPPIEGAESETPKTRSVSQRSFDSQVEHFKGLVALIATEPTYKNTDEELSLTALQAKASKMENVNKRAKEAESIFGDQLRTRNKLLYQKKYGLKDTAMEVKKIVRSAYGVRSPEAKTVNAIRFKTFTKLKL